MIHFQALLVLGLKSRLIKLWHTLFAVGSGEISECVCAFRNKHPQHLGLKCSLYCVGVHQGDDDVWCQCVMELCGLLTDVKKCGSQAVCVLTYGLIYTCNVFIVWVLCVSTYGLIYTFHVYIVWTLLISSSSAISLSISDRRGCCPITTVAIL